MTTNARAELILDARAELGEGAIWDDRVNRLCWVDIQGGKLCLFDPASQANQEHDMGQMIGTVVPRRQGGYMVALHHGFAAYDPQTRRVEMMVDPEKNPHIRFNDGKCDPSGRFWAGTIPLNGGKPIAHLFRLDADHTCHTILDGVACSNGIVWTADRRTMYYIDTPRRIIDAFDYDDATGAVSNRRSTIVTDKSWGMPDGMTIDEQGRLWVAFWGGSCVRCIDPQAGQVVRQIDVDAPQVTSCAFGGPNFDELYITSAWSGMDDQARAAHPHSGSLFVARPGVRGLPAFAYAG